MRGMPPWYDWSFMKAAEAKRGLRSAFEVGVSRCLLDIAWHIKGLARDVMRSRLM